MQQTRGRAVPAPRPDPWRRIDAPRTWSDLVAPDATVARLQSVPALLSERYWTGSAAAGESPRRGVLLLFAGSAGTGRTLAAQVLAHELGVPVLRVDLESMFAGGRGEAARLVARLFATAQRLGAVLELDHGEFALSSSIAAQRPTSTRAAEADLRDLFGHCESHTGVVVFPTSRLRDVDPGVRARFDDTIEFPFPEQAARAEIWRRSLPAGSVVSERERSDLAGAFQLPGAAIAACCASADRIAASEGAAVSLDHIARALDREYATRLVSDHTRAALAHLRARAAAVPLPIVAAEPVVAVPEREPQVAVAPEPEVVVAPEPEPEEVVAPEPEPKEVVAPEPEPEVVSAPAPAEPAFAEVLAAAVTEAPPPEPSVPEPEPPLRDPEREPAGAPAAAGAAPIDNAAADDLVRAMAASSAAIAGPGVQRPRRREAGRSARRLIPLVAIGAVSAVVLGLAAAHQRHKPNPPAPAATSQTLRTNALRFTFPSGWTHAPVPSLSGLQLHDAVAVASTSSPAGRLVVGIGSAQSGSPLPARFISANLPGAPTPQLVSLGGRSYERVLDPRLALGGASQSVYAQSSPAGPVIAVCQTSSQAFTASCERALATLRVTASAPRASSPRPSRAYAAALGGVLSQLDRARATAAHDLAAAHTAREQATAAGTLAGLHARAAAEVAALHAGPAASANAELSRALRALADAYGTLGRGALHDDAHEYRVGQADVMRASDDVSSALSQLSALGYSVR